jgi:hypothetical protein
MIPAGVIQVRRDICHDCPTPCADRPDAACSCAACPIARWGKYGACNGTETPPEPQKLRGLGDLVAVFAEPIARAINLDKSKCGCGKKQDWLNAKVPFAR